MQFKPNQPVLVSVFASQFNGTIVEFDQKKKKWKVQCESLGYIYLESGDITPTPLKKINQ
jgi:transcription antitermination factor NusG